MDKLAYTPEDCNYLETLAKTFVIHVTQNQFIPENIFGDAPLHLIATAMITSSAFSGWYTGNFSGINNLISDNLESTGVVNA